MRRSTPAGTRWMTLLMLVVVGLTAAHPLRAAWVQPSIALDDKPMQVDGRLPQSGLISTSPDPVPEGLEQVEMLRETIGLVDSFDARAMGTINRIADPVEPDESLRVGRGPGMYLQLRRGDQLSVLGIHPIDEHILLLTDAQSPDRRWRIRRDVFERLGITIERRAGVERFAGTDQPKTLEMPAPHAQSPIELDRRTIRARIKMNYPKLTRELGQETFRVRLPKAYDPATPSGVLVWISPSPDGRIPEIFAPICDELGLIAVGVDNNGNRREITDRLQNHLDSIETLARSARIDQQRIYLTGVSGGGRSSSILQLAFPEHFAGCVPIIGLDTYHNAPTGDPGKYWPKRLGKPSGPNMQLLKLRRIRSITGTADFNEPEMTLRTRLLRDDGLDAQIDVIDGMAHAMPSAEQFAQALRWVDQPRREAIEAARATAEQILKETSHLDPALPAVRDRLIEVMQILPYSDPAWRAAERLGYTRPD